MKKEQKGMVSLDRVLEVFEEYKKEECDCIEGECYFCDGLRTALSELGEKK